MEAILEKLIESPRLSLFNRQIQQVLDAEQVRRAHFIETMTEGEKVEFINGEVIVHSPVKLQHNVATKALGQVAWALMWVSTAWDWWALKSC